MSSWIFIERQHNPHVIIGPFKNLKEAHKYDDEAIQVEDIVQEDCLDMVFCDSDERKDTLVQSCSASGEKIEYHSVVRRKRTTVVKVKLIFDVDEDQYAELAKDKDGSTPAALGVYLRLRDLINNGPRAEADTLLGQLKLEGADLKEKKL